MLVTLIFLRSLPQQNCSDSSWIIISLDLVLKWALLRGEGGRLRCKTVPLSMWNNLPDCKFIEHQLCSKECFAWTMLRSQVSFTEYQLLVSHNVPETELEKLRQKAVLELCHCHRGMQRTHARDSGFRFDFSSGLDILILMFIHCFNLWELL